MAVNDFEAEALIIAQIKAAVAGLNLVCSLRSVSGAANLGPQLPAAIVAPVKSTTEQQFARGRGAKVREHWRVILTVQDTPDAVKFAADFSDAGALMADIRQALQGWQPGATFDLMQFDGRGEPGGQPGEIEFPLEFSVLHSLEMP